MNKMSLYAMKHVTHSDECTEISIHLCNCSCSHRTPSSAPFQSLTTNWSETTGEDPFLLLLLQSQLKMIITIIIMIIYEKLKNIITDMHGLHHAIQSRSPLSCPNNLSVSKNFRTLKRCMSSAASTSLTLMSLNPQICFTLIAGLNIKQNLKLLLLLTPLEVCLHTHTCITTCGSPWTKE